MISALVLIPLLAGAVAFLLPNDSVRRALLVVTALTHTGLTCASWMVAPSPEFGGWLALGPLERYFLSVASVLFLATTIYAVGYLAREDHGSRPDLEEGFLFSNAREATFIGCLLLFLAAMTLVVVSQHLGLIWVAVEGTTLASAPLIHYHQHHRSLEAAWKYLVICSVGIAFALLGNFFLVVATTRAAHGPASMTLQELVRHAAALDPGWLKAAFLLLLVGYGTKMGLAPLHTWLPDAHSEAPSVISALLSGALLNCALLAILRVHAICVAAGLASFSQALLTLFGLLSMGLAAVFIVGQADYKRMLAYSSVEHMGVIAFGAGIGGTAGFGALLHVMNHSLAKAMLFLLAGNILAASRTKVAGRVTGLLQRLPVTGALWLAGFFAITGSPPFGLFISELTVLRGTLEAQRYVVAALYLAFLLIAFVGMARIMLRMAHGEPAGAPGKRTREHEPLSAILPPAALGLGALALGLGLPAFLRSAIESALQSLGMN